MKKEEVQEAYKILRDKQGKSTYSCLNYLFKMHQNQLIHHFVGMENLTTIEKQYILSLIEEK